MSRDVRGCACWCVGVLAREREAHTGWKSATFDSSVESTEKISTSSVSCLSLPFSSRGLNAMHRSTAYCGAWSRAGAWQRP